MKIVYDPVFFKKLKKLNIRIRKSFNQKLTIFVKNPHDPLLNNHALKREYAGYRSIDVTADWRVVYHEEATEEEIIAYFADIGTHYQLYKKQPEESSS